MLRHFDTAVGAESMAFRLSESRMVVEAALDGIHLARTSLLSLSAFRSYTRTFAGALSKAPKLHFHDTELVRWLLGIRPQKNSVHIHFAARSWKPGWSRGSPNVGPIRAKPMESHSIANGTTRRST